MVKVDATLYPIVLAIAALAATACWFIGLNLIGGKRGKMFTPEFLSQWDKEHEAAMGAGTKVAGGGYPDCGTGKYSEKLSYADWMAFNLEQRSHKNFIENLAIFVFTIMAVGVVYPLTAVIIGAIWLVLRIAAGCGYKLSAKARVLPTQLMLLTTMVMFIMAIVSCCMWIYATPW